MPSVDYIVKLVLDVDNRTTGVKLKPGLQFCQSKENCCPQQSERQRKRLKMLSSPLSEVQGPSAGDQAMPDPFVQELKNSQDNEDDELQELSKDEISMGDEKASNKLSALPCRRLFYWFLFKLMLCADRRTSKGSVDARGDDGTGTKPALGPGCGNDPERSGDDIRRAE